MGLEIMMLSEISRAQKDRLSFICQLSKADLIGIERRMIVSKSWEEGERMSMENQPIH